MPAGRNGTVSTSPDLLARIDRVLGQVYLALAELQAIRAAVAVRNLTVEDAEPTEDDGSAVRNLTAADDLADGNLLDTHAASARFNYDRHTLARWCRTEGLGVRRGGRWLVSIPRLQRRLNGGG